MAHLSVLSVLRAHRHTLLTLGTGVLIISAARATRQTIVPLWAASQGLSPSTVSLVYGVSAGVDMLLFYPGGAIMDRYGRVFVAVPSMVVLGLGFLLLPLTHATPAIAAVAGLMGLGNGISAGVVMTLGADAAPAGGAEPSSWAGGGCAPTSATRPARSSSARCPRSPRSPRPRSPWAC